MGKKLLTNVTLDEILSAPEKYHKQNVELNGLVIDKIIHHPRFYPTYVLVHQWGGEKKGFIFAYYGASLIAQISEPGQKIKVRGTFRNDSDFGQTTKYLEVYEMENHSLREIVV